MEAKTTVRNNQNLFDISLQVSGSCLARVIDLARLNDISITDHLTAGGVLLTGVSAADQDILNHYKREGITPATGNPDNLEVPVLGGIGYMAIGLDFKVS